VKFDVGGRRAEFEIRQCAGKEAQFQIYRGMGRPPPYRR